jgi:regulator of protease activity HflC (stomatin/prohibitin superfamily)
MSLLGFILSVLLALVGVVVFIAGFGFRGARISAVGCFIALLGTALIVSDSYTTVASRGVAVQTAFGKVRGDVLGPGFHWVDPWNEVEEFDASVQTLRFYADEPDRSDKHDYTQPGDDGGCINVRLATNTTACVDVTAQWNINHTGDVKSLYLQYKTFNNLHDNLVVRQLQSALNEVFGTYDPLATVNNADAPAVNTKELQTKVKAALASDLTSAINIDSVTIPLVHFDNPTEERLRNYQQALADTRIAVQRQQTAHAQAEANNALAGSAAIKDPGVQYQNCLDLIDRLSKANQLGNLPPTFNCGGSSAGVILQTK